jgi:hypothetical protein
MGCDPDAARLRHDLAASADYANVKRGHSQRDTRMERDIPLERDAGIQCHIRSDPASWPDDDAMIGDIRPAIDMSSWIDAGRRSAQYLSMGLGQDGVDF